MINRHFGSGGAWANSTDPCNTLIEVVYGYAQKRRCSGGSGLCTSWGFPLSPVAPDQPIGEQLCGQSRHIPQELTGHRPAPCQLVGFCGLSNKTFALVLPPIGRHHSAPKKVPKISRLKIT